MRPEMLLLSWQCALCEFLSSCRRCVVKLIKVNGWGRRSKKKWTNSKRKSLSGNITALKKKEVRAHDYFCSSLYTQFRSLQEFTNSTSNLTTEKVVCTETNRTIFLCKHQSVQNMLKKLTYFMFCQKSG